MKSETSDLLSTHSLDDVVMNRKKSASNSDSGVNINNKTSKLIVLHNKKKSSFSRMTFNISRLERIEQVVAGHMLGMT